MNGYRIILLLTAGLLCVTGCGVSDSENDSDNGHQTITYTLTTRVSPSEGGSVEPSGGQYSHGSSVSIQANPNQGWIFTEWGGDIQSTDNPLVYLIEKDTDLTANFEDIRSGYTVELIFSGSTAALDYLEFGQMEDPVTEQAPPTPPHGTLHAFFYYNGYELFKDYRNDFEPEITWELYYQASEGESLSLEWEVNVAKMSGSLTLGAPDSNLEVDMVEENSIDFQNGDFTYFLIHYKSND
jgi:hypothetical protein